MLAPRLFHPEEQELGQTWLRMFRSQVPTFTDPLVYDYVDQLLTSLARHSELKDRRLDLIIVENPTMNAAVPGGGRRPLGCSYLPKAKTKCRQC